MLVLVAVLVAVLVISALLPSQPVPSLLRPRLVSLSLPGGGDVSAHAGSGRLSSGRFGRDAPHSPPAQAPVRAALLEHVLAWERWAQQCRRALPTLGGDLSPLPSLSLGSDLSLSHGSVTALPIVAPTSGEGPFGC